MAGVHRRISAIWRGTGRADRILGASLLIANLLVFVLFLGPTNLRALD